MLPADGVTCTIGVRLTLPSNLGTPAIDRVSCYARTLDAKPGAKPARITFDTPGGAAAFTSTPGWHAVAHVASPAAGATVDLRGTVVLAPSRVVHIIVYAHQPHPSATEASALHPLHSKVFESKLNPSSGVIVAFAPTSQHVCIAGSWFDGRACVRGERGDSPCATGFSWSGAECVASAVPVRAGSGPVGAAERAAIERWISAKGLDRYGNPSGTMYAGGSPTFNMATGVTTDRFEYIAMNHPDKPWAPWAAKEL